MGIVIYALLLIFFLIPITFRAYLSLSNERSPLPHFQNNIVVSRIKTRRALGVLSPILFWLFHSLFVIGALAGGAWIAALAVAVYVVASVLLSAQIKAKGMRVIAGVALPGGLKA